MTPLFAIVFDIDDTLYLERDYAHSGFTAVGQWMLDTLGIGGFGETCAALFDAGRRGDVFNLALEHLVGSHDPSLVQQLVGVYRAHAPRIGLLPDASRLLASFTAEVATAAISDGPFVAQRQKALALDLPSRLNVVLLTDQWGREFWKPHPRAFQSVQAMFGLSGGQCAYVADNPTKDFHAPRRLGWTTIRVRRAGGLHQAAPNDPQAPPDYELTDLEDLAGLLRAVGGTAA